MVETYYDPYYANNPVNGIIDYAIDAQSSWILTSNSTYTSTTNFTVTLINIAFSVATGVVAAYIGINGVAAKILGYVGVGWTAAQSFTQQYLTYASSWTNSNCSVYYKTKYDYYVIPKSANGSTVTAYIDFYKFQYVLNANPSSIPNGCAGFKSYTDGPYSYH